MEQLYHGFGYLKKYKNYEIVIDPSDQVIDQAEFEHQYWTSVHISGKDYLPPKITATNGLHFLVQARFDSDYAVNTVTR